MKTTWMEKVQIIFTTMRTRLQETRRSTILIALLTSLLLFTILLRLLTPPQSGRDPALLIPRAQLNDRPLPETIQINASFPELGTPDAFTIEQFRITPISLTTLIEEFGLTTSAGSTLAVSKDGRTSVSMSRENRVTMTIAPETGHLDVTPFLTLDFKKAQETADAFIRDRLKLSYLVRLDKATRYAIEDGSHAEDTDDPNKADWVFFTYEYRLERETAWLGFNTSPPLTIAVDKAQRIRKVEFAAFEIATREGSILVDAIKPDEALKNHRGDSHVLRFYRDNAEPIPLSSVRSINASQVTIQYRIDPQSGAAIPYYLFGGTISTADVPASISFLIPAVKIKVAQ